WRAERRLKMRQVDTVTRDLDDALKQADAAKNAGKAKSIAPVGNASEIHPEMIRRGIVPDVVTDQTSAHDVMHGYIPAGLSIDAANDLRKRNPKDYERRAMESMATHVRAMLDWKARGAIVFDYGNNLRQRALDQGVGNAFDYPGFVPAYIRPLFCEGKGPFRWVALSGDPEDIYRTDEAVARLFPHDTHLHRWLKMAKEQVAFQGLPARICWLGYGERAKAGLKFNELVRTGKISAPIVIGRDHLDCGSVASPYRETEGMKDTSDAVADWPLLNFALNAVGGATWVSFHHGGGVGMGLSLHAGMVVVCDGSREADERLKRVLTYDPGMGVIRHADAGYERAIANAHNWGVRIPMEK